MNNSRNLADRCDIFISAPNPLKEAYVRLEAGRRYKINEHTITFQLHQYFPRFLELDARWVDALLEAEGDMKNNVGDCSLMYLFWSKRLDNFDFGCSRFQELLQRQRDWVSNRN